MTLLDVRDLRVSYRSSGPAVRGIDLQVQAGEVVAVVGESGSGKSTTAHAVLGLLAAGGRVDGGQVLFDGQDLVGLGERRLRAVRGREIGLVPQDPTVSLNPVKRIGEQVAEVLIIHALADRRTAALDAVELLAAAGLPDPELRARQFPHHLSGGMRQRVLVAIALAAKPKLLIADEPTSALDVTVQRQILDLIEQATRESGTAVLLVTHDLGIAAERASRLIVMSDGRVVETGPTADVLSDPQHEYTRTLLSAVPRIDAAPARPRRTDGRPLLVVEDLAKDFPLGRGRTLRAVDGVSFQVHAGETFALVGESGSGKSTTARLVLRLTDPTAGTVTFDGRDVTRVSGRTLRDLRRHVQVVYQNPFASLDPRFTVAQIVEEPLRVFRVGSRTSRRDRARDLLTRVALPESVLQRRPAELSGGQRQRVAIARALSLQPSLVVCDEPVSALDVSVQAQVLELFAELQDELGLAYLFISHDLAVVRQLADHVGVMQAGRLVEAGPADEIFAAPSHPYTRELLAAVPGTLRSHT